MYGDHYAIAPLSVVLDPVRARRVLRLEPGKSFSPKVLYIFEKQLEEADLLVINKCDLIDERQQDELQQALESRFSQATVLRVSARTGMGFEKWLELLQSLEGSRSRSMDVDYDLYAEGESLLGWLNLSAALEGTEFDGNQFLRKLGKRLRDELEARQIEVAHLKMTLAPDAGQDLAVGNLTRNQSELELSHELAEPLAAGELLLNLRAEGDPDQLRILSEKELAQLARDFELTVAVRHVEAFRPGRPVPTHRLTGVT
jgi:hypothetical protein